jgi:formate hydrogenlyase subunit 6/NADH:ubiquinone oxidoreductase subunit I
VIVNIKDTEIFPAITNFIRSFKLIFRSWSVFFLYRKMRKDSLLLKNQFYDYYPELQNDGVGNSLCISCDLCTDVCASDAIEIKKPNIVNFPTSLNTGEAPQHFYLDLTRCTRCNLCVQTCPVDALKLSGDYSDIKKVDLVKKNS